MEAAYSSETSEQTYYPIWYENLRDCHLTITRLEDLKTYIHIMFFSPALD
jgi:hypothetical protein